jgi:hypothetical protein
MGLTGYWRMEEALWDGTPGEVKDSSGLGYHGTSFNGPTTIAGGKLGRGGDFDATGSEYLELPKEAFNHLEGSWAMWAKGVWSSQGVLRFFNITNGGGSALQYLSHLNNVWLVPNGTTRATVDLGTLTDNLWQLLMFTWKYDGANSTIKGYLDGALKDTQILSGQMSAAAVPITIMGDTTVGSFTTGQVDELAIWDRELSQTEAAVLYNTGLGRIIK